MLLPRPIESLTIVGLGKSVYDWVRSTYTDFSTLGEVWTINAGCGLFRCDVMWDMHDEDYIAALKDDVKIKVLKRREWLKTYDKPLMLPKALPDYPTSMTFPLRQVIEQGSSCYFANGLAYLLAMAFCCDVQRLSMFGCDFSYDRDTNTHDEQGRACCEYWVGRLVQKGCKISTPLNSHFMDGHRRGQGKIYGYHQPVEFDFPVAGGKGKFVGPDYT